MTRDTEMALNIIEPIARMVGVEVEADDNLLYINNDGGIGIAFNSTKATVLEFVGWLIIYYDSYFRCLGLSEKQLDTIKMFWYSQEWIDERRRDGEEKSRGNHNS